MSIHPDGVQHLPTPDEYRDAYRRLRYSPFGPDAPRLRAVLEVGALAVMAEDARLRAVAANGDTTTKQAVRLAALTEVAYQMGRDREQQKEVRT